MGGIAAICRYPLNAGGMGNQPEIRKAGSGTKAGRREDFFRSALLGGSDSSGSDCHLHCVGLIEVLLLAQSATIDYSSSKQANAVGF